MDKGFLLRNPEGQSGKGNDVESHESMTENDMFCILFCVALL